MLSFMHAVMQVYWPRSCMLHASVHVVYVCCLAYRLSRPCVLRPNAVPAIAISAIGLALCIVHCISLLPENLLIVHPGRPSLPGQICTVCMNFTKMWQSTDMKLLMMLDV